MHTHTHINICMYVCVYMYMYVSVYGIAFKIFEYFKSVQWPTIPRLQ